MQTSRQEKPRKELYRQALLDIPEQEGFPWGGVVEDAPWPEIP
jgi:hypothetical protein